MKVGILALQGAVEPHEEKLKQLGVESVRVLRASDLDQISGIILPGGESTTMLHVLGLNDLFEPLREFALRKPAWGICAGSILLAKRVSSPKQASLEIMDIEVERNAFGRQAQSFIAPLSSNIAELNGLEGVFIRAPRIRAVPSSVETLMTWEKEPVMVREGNWLASTFHPELAESTKLHEYFLGICEAEGNHG